MLLNKSEEIIKQIDSLYRLFRYSRSFLPYINSNLVGQMPSLQFNISNNVKSKINFKEPLDDDFIALNNHAGHFLNQNFLIRLYDLLDHHQIVSSKEKIINTLPGSDEIDILRRLRRLFSHTSGKYDKDDPEKDTLAKRIIHHFKLQVVELNDFPISIDTVIAPIVIKTKEYAVAKTFLLKE